MLHDNWLEHKKLINNFPRSVEWLLRDETGQEGLQLPLWGERQRLLKGETEWLRETYWTPLGCDLLMPGLDYLCFDLSYRFGVPLVIKWQKQTGVRTIQYTNLVPETLIVVLDALARSHLKSRPDWKSLRYQYSNRCTRVRRRALQMCGEVSNV